MARIPLVGVTLDENGNIVRVDKVHNITNDTEIKPAIDTKLITDINDFIKEKMKEKNISQTELAKRMNLTNQSAVSRLLKSDMKSSYLVGFLQVLGCELIVKDGEKSYTIEIEG